jgi:hypothetical protein
MWHWPVAVVVVVRIERVEPFEEVAQWHSRCTRHHPAAMTGARAEMYEVATARHAGIPSKPLCGSQEKADCQHMKGLWAQQQTLGVFRTEPKLT